MCDYVMRVPAPRAEIAEVCEKQFKQHALAYGAVAAHVLKENDGWWTFTAEFNTVEEMALYGKYFQDNFFQGKLIEPSPKC